MLIIVVSAVKLPCFHISASKIGLCAGFHACKPHNRADTSRPRGNCKLKQELQCRYLTKLIDFYGEEVFQRKYLCENNVLTD